MRSDDALNTRASQVIRKFKLCTSSLFGNLQVIHRPLQGIGKVLFFLCWRSHYAVVVLSLEVLLQLKVSVVGFVFSNQFFNQRNDLVLEFFIIYPEPFASNTIGGKIVMEMAFDGGIVWDHTVPFFVIKRGFPVWCFAILSSLSLGFVRPILR